MKYKYKKELEKVHAPEDLIKKTKILMEEEGKINKFKFGRYIAVAAAVAVLLITGAVYSKVNMNSNYISETSIYLDTQVSKEPQDMSKLDNSSTYKNANEIHGENEYVITISNTEVTISKNAISKKYQAYYELDEIHYIISSDYEDENSFVLEVTKYLEQ